MRSIKPPRRGEKSIWPAPRAPFLPPGSRTPSTGVAVPAGAQPPHAPGEWMSPFPPPLVEARTRVEVDGYAFDYSAPVESRQATTTTVLSYPLRIVPAMSVTVEPQQFVVVESRQPKQFELFARVHSFAQSPSKVNVGVEVPAGWKAPEAQSV